MIAGKDAPSFGEGKNSWLTGTAAWTFVSISQSILGVVPELDGLRISPSIPPEWKEYKVCRSFRGAEYEITVLNPNGVEHGIKEIRMDGKRMAGNLLPPVESRKKVTVEVIMG